MIISHKHKFIFLKARKTAGTSFEMMLSSICGEKDIITRFLEKDESLRSSLGYPGAQNVRIPKKKYTAQDTRKREKSGYIPRFRSHTTAAEAKKYIDPEIWSSYFKFTLDRNPFDKVVSFYYWKDGDQKFKDVNEFVKSGTLNILNSFGLYSLNGIVAVDKVYKFEDFDGALKDLKKRFNLSKDLELPNSTSGIRKVKGYKTLLNEESVDILKIMYAREIQLLGYEY
jgi:hypothetical protein